MMISTPFQQKILMLKTPRLARLPLNLDYLALTPPLPKPARPSQDEVDADNEDEAKYDDHPADDAKEEVGVEDDEANEEDEEEDEDEDEEDEEEEDETVVRTF